MVAKRPPAESDDQEIAKPIHYEETDEFRATWCGADIGTRSECYEYLDEIIDNWRTHGAAWEKWPKHLHPERMKYKDPRICSVRMSDKVHAHRAFFMTVDDPEALHGRRWVWVSFQPNHYERDRRR